MELTGTSDEYLVLRLSVAECIWIGHSGEVFATRFDPTGQHIASGSMDRSISAYHHVDWNFRAAIDLGVDSALAYLWPMRQLWCSDRSQRRSVRFTLVARLAGSFLGISRYDGSKLGFRDWT